METNKLQFTKLQTEIFDFLCNYSDREFNQSFIAKELKVSSTAVSKALILLKKNNLVSIKKTGKMNLNLIQLNREHSLVIHLKRAENLKKIYISGLVEHLEENFPGSTIILFGSYSKGEDVSKSDIDIAIIGKKEKHLDLSNFEKFLKKEIIINFYSEIKGLSKEMKESLSNGMVLSGSMEI
jgi:predicted nucleotidyltransferase